MSSQQEKVGIAMSFLKQWFSTKDSFAPNEYLPMSGDIFGCHNLEGVGGQSEGAPGILLVKFRDAPKHSTILQTSYRTAP